MLKWIADKYISYKIPYLQTIREQAVPMQHAQFDILLRAAKNTVFGTRYSFDKITTHKEFKEKVPLHTYEEIHPYIDRMMHGEQNVLWPGEVRWFSKSSGTTARSKFIPVSKEAMAFGNYKAGRELLASYFAQKPGNNLFAGKHLIMGGSLHSFEGNEQVQVGDVSAVLMKNITPWVQLLRTPSLKIALMPTWEAKLEVMAQQVSKQSITGLTGVSTWTLLLLKRVLEITGKSTIQEVWPDIQLFIHGGVNFEPYRAQFNQLIGKEMTYIDSYNASEGFFAFQDTSEKGDLLLPKHGIFYEFIPIENVADESPEALSLEQVEAGKVYEIVISTNGGLWRYRIGDTVRFVSVNPYRIVVAGRTKQYINIVGEELMVHNAELALAKTCKAMNVHVRDFTVAPIPLTLEQTGAHEWVIEFGNSPVNKDAFAQMLDKELQQANSDYEAKRRGDMALGMLQLTIVKPGHFQQWLKGKNKLGGQHKVPRLSNDRTVLEEILAIKAAS
jgi:hypothetical protein